MNRNLILLMILNFQQKIVNGEFVFRKNPLSYYTSIYRSLDVLDEYMGLQGINFQNIMEEIKSLVVSTIISTHTANASGLRLFVPNR
jgi:hypothetical protein